MNETTTKEHTMSKQVHVSHASCDHDKTPKARAVCRRIRRGGAPETSKAQIVARVKNTKSPVDKEITRRAKDRKIAQAQGIIVPEASAPVLRELLTLDNDTYPNSVDNEDELPVKKHYVPTNLLSLKAAFADDERPSCEEDEVVPVDLHVIAKGSKVVHVMIVGGVFACTKRPVNVDTAKITTNDVTCKNCLKITK